MAAVCRVEQFAQAIAAETDVGRDRSAGGGRRRTGQNQEAVRMLNGDGRRGNGINDGERRALCGEVGEKASEVPGWPFNFEIDAGAMIENPAADPQLTRERVDKGPEAYALHDSFHGDAPSFDFHGLLDHALRITEYTLTRRTSRRELICVWPFRGK